MSLLASKLKQCRIELELTQVEAAQASGLEQRDVSRLETGKTRTPPISYMQFLHREGVDLNYLLDDSQPAVQNASLRVLLGGPDKMNRTRSLILEVEKDQKFPAGFGVSASAIVKNQGRTQILMATQNTSSSSTYTVIDYTAATNYLNGYQSQEYYESLDVVVLPHAMTGSSSQGILLQIEGDSMTPKFHDGDWVACSLLDRLEWGQVRNDACCVVVSTTYGIQFKRIHNYLNEGFIRCQSDNQRHRPIDIPQDDLLQLFYFRLHVSPDDTNLKDSLYRKVDLLEGTTNDLRILLDQVQGRLDTIEQRPGRISRPNKPK